jgi:hypothetical protein
MRTELFMRSHENRLLLYEYMNHHHSMLENRISLFIVPSWGVLS